MKFLALGLVAGVAASASAGTPVKKVISMLADMQAKGNQAMADEANVYAEYSEWVRVENRDTEMAIGANKEEIAKQEGIKAKAEGDAAQFSDELGTLNGELASFTAELKSATEERHSEKEEFLATEQDYSESVDALGRAIGVLKSKAELKISELKFLQIPALMAKSPELTAFLQQPQASSYAYEGQSGGIVGVLEGLNKKFSTELSDLRTAEANSEHAYQLMKMNLDDEITNTEAAIANREAKLGEAKATAAKAKGDLATAKSELAANTKYVKDINATYSVKSSTFQTNQGVRTEELKALGSAIEILSGDALGSANKHTDSEKFRGFVQLKSTKAKAFLGASSSNVLKQVASMLQERDSEMGGKSKFLAMAAIQTLNGASSGAKGVFDKVIKMIEELLNRLQEEAAAEAEHKAFCDKELKENKLKREAKTQKVDELSAKSEQLNSAIASMSEKIAQLAKEQAELGSSMAEATNIRTKEKATNEETIVDAKAATVAVNQALAVLGEFYGAKGEALLQQQQVPEMAAYTGMGAGSKGVLGMLEVIQTDFARLESETAAEEAAAASEYESFMDESTALKKAKHDDEFKTSLEKDKTQHELKLTTKELKLTREELNASLDYYEQLKSSCIAVKVSYEERVAMREQEIASLKEALEVLDAHSASDSYKGF